MLKIIYDPDNGTTVPDGKLEDFLTAAQLGFYGDEIRVGNLILVDRFKLAAIQNEIVEIEFFYGDKKITITKFGVFRDWPKNSRIDDDIKYKFHCAAVEKKRAFLLEQEKKQAII